MYFDRYDIVTAYYLFFCDFHEGQFSKKYSRLSKITRYFKPSPNLTLETSNDNVKAIYDRLLLSELGCLPK